MNNRQYKKQCKKLDQCIGLQHGEYHQDRIWFRKFLNDYTTKNRSAGIHTKKNKDILKWLARFKREIFKLPIS